MRNKAALILAGGTGTRLWPLSTADNPKQFLQLFGGTSLLQQTFARLGRLIEPEMIFVSTNVRYAGKVAEQLPQLPPANIIVEPARRNTAPAIAICAAAIRRAVGDTVVGVFPSDHAVANEKEFARVIDAAYQFADASNHVVTIGITPTEPNTDFGYLELGAPINDDVRHLTRFVEKPSRERAEAFLEAGNFVWNGGMFIFALDTFEQLLSTTAPDIWHGATAFADSISDEDRDRIYSEMPSISFDYAVMERAPKVASVRGDFGWSDVGSWAAVARFAEMAATQPAYRTRAENVFTHSERNLPIAVVGVSNIAVIDSTRGVLVLDLSSAEGLSALVEEIER